MIRWGTLIAFASFPFVFASTTIQTNICAVPTVPVLSSPSGSFTTVSSHVLVTGTTTAATAVTIVNDGHQAATTTSDGNGAFQVQVTMAIGKHTGTVQAANPCGVSQTAPLTVTVNASNNTANASTSSDTASATAAAPSSLAITITDPVRNETVSPSVASLLLAGTTTAPAVETVSDNGAQVGTIDTPDIVFRMRVALVTGKNVIRVQAQAGAVSAVAERTVTRLAASAAVTQPWYQLTAAKLYALMVVIVLLVAAWFVLGVSRKRNRKRYEASM